MKLRNQIVMTLTAITVIGVVLASPGNADGKKTSQKKGTFQKGATVKNAGALPKTTSKSGKLLLAVIGHPKTEVLKSISVREGGFAIEGERTPKHVPFGIDAFNYDAWSIHPDERYDADNPQSEVAADTVGAWLTIYAYGKVEPKMVFQALGLELSEWVKKAINKKVYGRPAKDAKEFRSKGFAVTIAVRWDEQFTEIVVRKTK